MPSKELIADINRLPDHLIHYIYEFCKKKENKINYKKLTFRFIFTFIIIVIGLFCYTVGFLITNRLNIFINLFIGWIVFSAICIISILMYILFHPEILDKILNRRNIV